MTQFDAHDEILGDFFSGDKDTCLRIPHFQRGYSWGKSQVTDFITDLVEQTHDVDQYYFGQLTVIPDVSTDGVECYQLIDGQQRVTTSIILLACIRDIFAERQSSFKDEIETNLFNMTIDKTKEVHYKLILDDDDNIFFRDHILKKLPASSQEKINYLKNVQTLYETHVHLRDSYIQIYTELENELKKMNVESEKINYLNHLRSTLRKKFVVTQLKVAKQSQAYVMFNRMNDRGLPLANSDLAKDLILSKIYEETTTSTGTLTMDDGIKKWKDMENSAGKVKTLLSRFLHHYLVTYHSKNTQNEFVYNTNNKTFDKLEKIISSNTMSGGELLVDLSDKFVLYRVLRNPKNTSHPKVNDDARESLRWILQLKIQIVQPVLLAGIEKFTKNDFGELCVLILKWFFRVKSVANKNPSSLEVELAILAHEIYHNDLSLHDVTRQIQTQDAQGNPITKTELSKGIKTRLLESQNNISSSSFEELFKDVEFSGKHAEYTLVSIIEHMQQKKITDMMTAQTTPTVEHIMPQEGLSKVTNTKKFDAQGNVVLDSQGNPEKYDHKWLDYIKEHNSISDDRDAKSFVANYKNKLGNLTIIDKKKNSSIGVKPFTEKCIADPANDPRPPHDPRGCFKNSLIELNNDILTYKIWNKDSIQKRQSDLARLAKDIWNV
ncbi:MAG: hypothetical protein CXT78_04325 [Thaumarchaeota archaeon]|nr:MAG: hypothetical protein CXT78_04325 [Nitrososphaerota archaeon]